MFNAYRINQSQINKSHRAQTSDSKGMKRRRIKTSVMANNCKTRRENFLMHTAKKKKFKNTYYNGMI